MEEFMSEEKQQNNGEEKQKDSLSFLLDSSYPLLQKFRSTCPGTFKHSQNVSTLLESISISLGLDTTFMKILGQYHDIGKMMNPNFFTENQLDDENPHDKLDPLISYQLITRHVSDTALILLSDDHFSKKLIQIICQHHGTTIVKYFYKKAGSDIDDIFRYKSETPTCVESAALMITDQIEATIRSKLQVKDHNPSEIIETTVNYLLDDGQLDAVYMKLGDLKLIKSALLTELQAIFQKRVDYDEVGKKGK